MEPMKQELKNVLLKIYGMVNVARSQLALKDVEGAYSTLDKIVQYCGDYDLGGVILLHPQEPTQEPTQQLTACPFCGCSLMVQDGKKPWVCFKCGKPVIFAMEEKTNE